MAMMASCTKDPDNGGGNNGGNNGGGNNGNTYNGHEYVDLGLPSGTLWATCNVGATTPEGYGDYFAWGETSPRISGMWYDYKWFGNYDDDNIILTKYNDDDSLNTLLPEDDAATANWGNGWCTPTVDQWKELYQYVNSTGTIQNGVFGRLFASNNGRSLFLPATDLDNSEIGQYWSSSLYYNEFAWGFDFSAPLYFTERHFRCWEYSVRPVRSTH